VRDGEGGQHLGSEYQRNRPRRQSENQQRAAHQLNDPGHPQHRGERDHLPSEQAEELLQPVLQEQEPGADPQQRLRSVRQSRPSGMNDGVDVGDRRGLGAREPGHTRLLSAPSRRATGLPVSQPHALDHVWRRG
jgi:hypothetical protein